MRIFRPVISSAAVLPVSCFLRPAFKSLLLLIVSLMGSADTTVSSTELQLADLCFKSTGSDFLYTMQTQNDGCLLECIILTSSNKFRGEANYLTESKSMLHYLSGEPCRDSDHVSLFRSMPATDCLLLHSIVIGAAASTSLSSGLSLFLSSPISRFTFPGCYSIRPETTWTTTLCLIRSSGFSFLIRRL